MPAHINVGGVWKPATVWINVAGVWKKANLWANVAGVWKKISTAMSAQLLPVTIVSNISGSTATATLRVNSTGNFDATTASNVITTQFAWKTSVDPASAFSVYFQYVSGTITTGLLDQWLPLSSAQTLTVARGTVGNSNGTVNVLIADPVSSVVLASRQYNISANRTS